MADSGDDHPPPPEHKPSKLVRVKAMMKKIVSAKKGSNRGSEGFQEGQNDQNVTRRKKVSSWFQRHIIGKMRSSSKDASGGKIETGKEGTEIKSPGQIDRTDTGREASPFVPALLALA